jgi:hypothetical protein
VTPVSAIEQAPARAAGGIHGPKLREGTAGLLQVWKGEEAFFKPRGGHRGMILRDLMRTAGLQASITGTLRGQAPLGRRGIRSDHVHAQQGVVQRPGMLLVPCRRSGSAPTPLRRKWPDPPCVKSDPYDVHPRRCSTGCTRAAARRGPRGLNLRPPLPPRTSPSTARPMGLAGFPR